MLDVDQARLRPHLRDRAQREHDQARVFEREYRRANEAGVDTTTPAGKVPTGDDRQRLRGLPCIAPRGDGRPAGHRSGARAAPQGEPARAPPVSSRLVYAPNGQAPVRRDHPPARGLEHGLRFAVLGTEISMTSGRVQWTGEPSGRPPSLEDAAAAPTMTARRSSREPGGIVPREVYGVSQPTGEGGMMAKRFRWGKRRTLSTSVTVIALLALAFGVTQGIAGSGDGQTAPVQYHNSNCGFDAGKRVHRDSEVHALLWGYVDCQGSAQRGGCWELSPGSVRRGVHLPRDHRQVQGGCERQRLEGQCDLLLLERGVFVDARNADTDNDNDSLIVSL